MPINHPTFSRGMLGLVKDSADSVSSADLECNEVQRLLTALLVQPVRAIADRSRRDATKNAPETVTTVGRPPFNHGDHFNWG